MIDIKRALAVAVLLGITAVAVTQAATLLETTASTPTFGVTNSDSGPPPSLVESILDFDDNNGCRLQAHGATDISGSSAVSAQGSIVNGQSGPFRAFASAKITQVAVNTSGTAQDYQYHFALSGPTLELDDTLGAAAFYAATIKLNGIEIWSSTATLNGDYHGAYSLSQSGVDLGATFFNDGNNIGYGFGSYSNALALGTFQNGATVTVEAELQAWFEAPGYEISGFAQIGDPNDLTGGSGLGSSLSVVPEPAVGRYVMLGCLILVTQCFRKRVNSP